MEYISLKNKNTQYELIKHRYTLDVFEFMDLIKEVENDRYPYVSDCASYILILAANFVIKKVDLKTNKNFIYYKFPDYPIGLDPKEYL